MTHHTECPDGAADLDSETGPGERCPAVLVAVPAGNLAAGAAVTARGRMRREGPRVREESWAPGHSVLALQRTRAYWWPGGLELLLGHWSAALKKSLLGDSRNPLPRDTANPTDSGSLCSQNSPADASDKSPSKGGAHYHGNVTGSVRRKPGGVLIFKSL